MPSVTLATPLVYIVILVGLVVIYLVMEAHHDCCTYWGWCVVFRKKMMHIMFPKLLGFQPLALITPYNVIIGFFTHVASVPFST